MSQPDVIAPGHSTSGKPQAEHGLANLMNASALVVAAGLSSRMQAFKPLLPLGRKTVIETLIDTLQAAGLTDIVVVTGFCASEVEAHLAGRGIRFVRNERYAETEMYDSVKAGLIALDGRCHRFFFVPGDVPLFQPQTLWALHDTMRVHQADVAIPLYNGRRGHPVLIDARLLEDIRCYTGDGGLKGALQSLSHARQELAVPDPGILLDADTPDDYQRLLVYQQSMLS